LTNVAGANGQGNFGPKNTNFSEKQGRESVRPVQLSPVLGSAQPKFWGWACRHLVGASSESVSLISCHELLPKFFLKSGFAASSKKTLAKFVTAILFEYLAIVRLIIALVIKSTIMIGSHSQISHKSRNLTHDTKPNKKVKRLWKERFY
jgi:hypothetical protein